MAVQEREHSPNDGSQAFSLEYDKSSIDDAVREDIISYLGEYRFNIQRYNYELHFSGDSRAGLQLRDRHQGEPMSTKALRAIKERKRRGERTEREEAELIGIKSLEDQLRFAPSGSTVFWASPPGPKEEGYGDYGFMYVGVIDKENPLDAQLSMAALRIEYPFFSQFNSALGAFTGQQVFYESAEDFIKNPRVISQTIPTERVENILKNVFGFRKDKKEQEIFKQAIKRLYPVINEFIEFVRHGTKEEKLHAFHAIENYSLDLKKQYSDERNEKVVYIDRYQNSRLQELMPLYGYKEPPVVAGSCGATGSNSNNILASNYEKLMKTLFGEEGEECGCPDGNTDNHYHCPDCKKRYADETNKTPDQRTKQCSCNFEFAC
ncbi:MAG: hypothetical protein Q7S38_01740 [bacterium]|nr:hypothetical protein [bacterium]